MVKHAREDLYQMQSLPLEAKIRMSQLRIKDWYESWVKYEIRNQKTGKVRYVTSSEEPVLKDDEYIESSIDGQVYISFSGGKDSTVLKHIVDGMYDDVPALFVNTGLEYPEIQKFAMSQKNVITVRPQMRFDEVIKKYGYPVASKEVSRKIYYAKRGAPWAQKYVDGSAEYNGQRSRYVVSKRMLPLLDAPFDVSPFCCDVMKKKPFKLYEKETGRKAIVGVLADESEVRKQAWMRTGCNAFDGVNPKSQPLSFWTEQDILEYLKKYNVPYCSVYGDLIEVDGELEMTKCNRTGCIFCLFGIHLESEPNRIQQLKETHPNQYKFCIGGGEMVDGKWQPNKKGLGLAKVLDYINVDYK